MKKTVIDTTMRNVAPVSGPTGTTPADGEKNQYFEGKGGQHTTVPQPRSYEGTGVELNKKK